MVYRRVLAAQPDNSVTIASIGMLTNLYLLFQSEGDTRLFVGVGKIDFRRIELLISRPRTDKN